MKDTVVSPENIEELWSKLCDGDQLWYVALMEGNSSLTPQINPPYWEPLSRISIRMYESKDFRSLREAVVLLGKFKCPNVYEYLELLIDLNPSRGLWLARWILEWSEVPVPFSTAKVLIGYVEGPKIGRFARWWYLHDGPTKNFYYLLKGIVEANSSAV